MYPCFAMEFYTTEFSIRDLEKFSSPATRLLLEMERLVYSVQMLTEILSRCELLEVLSLLTPHKPVRIEKQPAEDEEVFVSHGGQLKLEVVFSGNPLPRCVWFHNNNELDDQRSPVLLKEEFTEEDEGEYTCLVIQGDSEDEEEEIVEVATRPVEVKLFPEPVTIIRQPVDVECKLGGDIVLSCCCEGLPPPIYQWYHGNTALTGWNTENLIIRNASPRHAGVYKCYISNGYSEVYSDKVTVTVSPLEKQFQLVSEKVALLIANEEYENMDNLLKPITDVVTLTEILTNLGFKVLALCNLTLIEMRNAVKKICEKIPEEAYVLFYYAGHGFELHVKGMLPVDAPEQYKYEHCLTEGEVRREILNKNPKLFLLILDTCRSIPKREDNPGIFTAELPFFDYQIKRNFVGVCSTASYQSAYERKSEINGIYMKHLKKFLTEMIPITEILEKTQKSLYNEDPEVAERQIPTYENSLADSYYLTNPTAGNKITTSFFQSMNSIDDPKIIIFPRTRTKGLVTFQKYRNCFNNVLEMRLKYLHKWELECEILPFKKLKLNLFRDGNDAVLQIFDLQKIMVQLTVPISLKKDRKLVDNCLLELTKHPLIVSAELWYKSRQLDETRKEEEEKNNMPITNE
ncbi:mucosa-associated lymphoid tissue lymphoma translocation protein 1 [Anabrus simplex]|uniref:mucosa-associated lymphoid tissue lymphoma translocation protein 1 n=1 Tax=Anabrus simplex TaxID=316456 RepID=UPI0035A2F1F4